MFSTNTVISKMCEYETMNTIQRFKNILFNLFDILMDEPLIMALFIMILSSMCLHTQHFNSSPSSLSLSIKNPAISVYDNYNSDSYNNNQHSYLIEKDAILLEAFQSIYNTTKIYSIYDCSIYDILLQTNASHHLYPYLASTITITILVVLVIIIALYGNSLDSST